jgi:hypothetical protein
MRRSIWVNASISRCIPPIDIGPMIGRRTCKLPAELSNVKDSVPDMYIINLYKNISFRV